MKYPLLKRFVSKEELPPGVVAHFDEDKCLLRIDREFHDRMATPAQRMQLWRATETILLAYEVNLTERTHGKKIVPAKSKQY